MTQPIQEPLTQRSISQLTWGQNQLFRRPDISSGGCCPAWMAVYDNLPYGQEINSADGVTALEYPYCDWSDNAVGIFDYVRTAGSVADNNYNIQLLRDGVYSITYSEISEDMGGPNYSIRYSLNLGMEYPGRDSSLDPAWMTYTVTDFQTAAGSGRSWSTDYVYFHNTMVLPLQLIDDSPGTVYPVILFQIPAGAANFDINFRNRLWITWHGPIEHAEPIEDHRDPYPYHPEDF